MSFQHTADPMAAAGQGGALAACLLDFESFPGRYALALREPRLLFDRGTEVLMLAGGRAVEGMPQDPALAERLRTAARFFVRAGLLRSGVDHYTLLGLVPGCTAAQVRDHYRLLMRLTHPDFAGDGQDWPADAATRINRPTTCCRRPSGAVTTTAPCPGAGNGSHPARSPRRLRCRARRPGRSRPARAARWSAARASCRWWWRCSLFQQSAGGC